MASVPTRRPGELGVTVAMDKLIAESQFVRILLRQAVAFRDSIALRFEYVRAPGSSTETWWDHVRAVGHQQVIQRGMYDEHKSANECRIEIIDGPDLMVRDGGRADEDYAVVDYMLSLPEPGVDCILQFDWPEFDIRQARLTLTVPT